MLNALRVSLPAVTEHIQGGRLRALVVTAAERSRVLPDMQTTPEAGYPELLVMSWQGLLAPSATRLAAIARLNAEVNAAIRSDKVRDWVFAQG